MLSLEPLQNGMSVLDRHLLVSHVIVFENIEESPISADLNGSQLVIVPVLVVHMLYLEL